MKQIIVHGFLLIQVSQFACKENPVEPVKNPREYTWSADTIYYPNNPAMIQVMMQSVWGSDENNVYAAGFTSGTGGKMWRFDGAQWQGVVLPTPITGGQSVFNFSSVLGFSPADIYAIGYENYWNLTPPPNFLDSSLVLHFDGSKWLQIQLPGRSGYLGRIWGSSPSNIYVGGRDAIWHFDGGVWTKHLIPVTDVGERIGVAGLTGNQLGTIFVSYETHESNFARTRHYFLSFQNGAWQKLDSAVVEPGNVQKKWGYSCFWTSPQGTMYSVDADIFRWSGSSWVKTYEGLDGLAYITGTSDSNIFVTGHFGTFLHYNGIDWYRFESLRNSEMVYVGAWTDGDELFLSGWIYGGSKTILLHGK